MLKKISQLMPGVTFDLFMGTLTPDKEREFGEILVKLGDLLVSDANDRRSSEGQVVDVPTEQSKGLTKRLPGETP